MPHEPLQPDEESLEQWKSLPQNAPTPRAMPPVFGGARWTWLLLIGFGLLILLALLLGRPPA